MAIFRPNFDHFLAGNGQNHWNSLGKHAYDRKLAKIAKIRSNSLGKHAYNRKMTISALKFGQFHENGRRSRVRGRKIDEKSKIMEIPASNSRSQAYSGKMTKFWSNPWQNLPGNGHFWPIFKGRFWGISPSKSHRKMAFLRPKSWFWPAIES